MTRRIEAETILNGTTHGHVQRTLQRSGAAIDAPSSENLCECDDIVLGIAALDAQRVKFENLTAQIFVEAAAGALAGQRIRTDRLRVVEIELHRRMAFDRQHHVGEVTRNMRPNGVPFEGAGEQRTLRLLNGNREVVAPEAHQAFAERFLRLETMRESR